MPLLTRAAKAAVAGLLLSVVSLTTSAGTVWFADSKNLQRLNTTTNQVALTVKAEDIRSLAANADGSVWTLSKKRLTQYALNGAVVVDLDLKVLSLKSADTIALDSRDGSLWVAEGKDDDEKDDDDNDGHAKRIVRLNAAGQRVQDFASPGRIRAMALSLDQSLWLLGNKTLWHYAQSGERLAAIDLKPITKDKPKLLALDALGVWLWMGADKHLIRVDGHTSNVAPLKLNVPKEIELLTIDPRTGDVWAGTEQALYRYADTAALKTTVDLKALGVKDPNVLVFDPANQALWLGHGKNITRFAADGTKLATLAGKEDIEAIAVAPFALAPTLDIVAPTLDQVGNDPLPLFRLKAGAQCNSDPCAFSASYFDSYRLSAKLNGLEIGNLFARLSGTPESTYRPTTRLPDGVHVLTAQATDSFGQVSALRETRFTLDTTPPKFGSVTPADASLFRTPAVTLAGSVDETAGIRLDGPGTSLSASGTTFSFPLTLNEGANRFTLHATDAAGNAADKSLTYTLDSIPPKFLGIAPADGTVSSSPSVTFTGSVDESATIQLSGDGVAQTAMGTSFSFPVILKVGTNVYTITATDKVGNVATTSVRLTLIVPLKFATLSPATGTYFGNAKVSLVGSLSEPANIKLTGEGLTLTARGDKFSLPVTLNTGVNVFHVTGTSASGSSADADLSLTFVPVTVAVTSPVDIASTTDTSIAIAGTFTGPPGTTVTINGENVALNNGSFMLTVPLSFGPNVFNVLAMSPERDALAQATVIIQRKSAQSAVVITFESPVDGAVYVAPATILVKAQARRADGSTQPGLQIRNDSPVGFQNGVGETDFAEYEWKDVPKGTYPITATVTDDNGTALTKTVTVTVEADPLDKPFMTIWNGFKDALLAGNKSAALEFVAVGSRERYTRVFTDLMPMMQEVFGSLYGIRRNSLDENVAEYFVNQKEETTDRELGFSLVKAHDTPEVLL